MKIRVTLSTSFFAGQHEEDIECPDDTFDGMDAQQKSVELSRIWLDWASKYVSGGATIIE